MLKVLVVSPHFPPTNAADMQRVRLVLPYLREAGIEATVLAVAAASVNCPVDRWLEDSVPSEVEIRRVAGLGKKWCCIPGLGTLTNRVYRALKIEGSRILAGPYDLVYFSTTQFGVHELGSYWSKKFGVPFVMDYQDPWVNDYYEKHTQLIPPGGRFKYAVAHWLAKYYEPRMLLKCSGITSVSADYPRQLYERYDFLNCEFPVLVAPFPGDSRDLERVRDDTTVRQSVFDPKDGCLHWIYVGRGGEDMHRALRAFFAALRSELQLRGDLGSSVRDAPIGQSSVCSQKQFDASNLKIHFVGTSYAAFGKGMKTIEPLALEYGLGDIVVEHTDRIPYSQTLRCLLDADALIVPGSDDPGYTASKIYPYLLARKPMLAVFHYRSSVVDLVEKVGGAICVAMNEGEAENELSEKIRSSWFSSQKYSAVVPLRETSFEPYTAKSQALQLAEFFRVILKRRE